MGQAVLTSGTLSQPPRRGFQDFYLYPVKALQFGESKFGPGRRCGTRGPGDNIAQQCRLEGRTFTVKFRLPEGLGNPTD